MARNFRVMTKTKSRKLLGLKLFGDFDGASADQLLHLLSRKIGKVNKVAIDTDGLRNINAFGIDVFMPGMTRLSWTQAEISITGKFKRQFSTGL